MERKDLKHITGEQISTELEEEDRERIASMGGWIESKQLPILTEKILLLRLTIKELNKSIKKMDRNTNYLSRVIVSLTLVLVVAASIQITISVMIYYNFSLKGVLLSLFVICLIFYFLYALLKEIKPGK